MNLKKLGRTFWVIAAVAIMAMVLQGCGGDDGVNPTTHEDLQDLYDQLKEDYDQAVEDRDAAQMALGSMDDAADMDGSAYAQRNHYMSMASMLQMEIGDPSDTAAMDGSLNAQLNYHMKMVSTLQGQIGDPSDAASMSGSLNAQLNHYKDMVSTLQMEIGSPGDTADKDGSLHAQLNYYKAKEQDDEDKAAYDKAKAVNTAIRAATGTAPDYTVEATATDLVVESTGYTDGGAESGLPTGWRGMTLTKDDDMLVVYSDVEDADPTMIGVLYNGTVTNNVRMYHVDETQVADGSGVEDGEIQLADVRRDSNTILTDNKGTTETTDDVNTFPGSVRGVPGTFSCTGNDCTFPNRISGGSGKVVADGGAAAAAGANGWTFTPTDPNAMVNVQDDGYLSLGWWLGKNTDGTYSFDTIAMGHGDLMADYGAENTVAGVTVPAPTAGTIDGKATYKGAAAGKYSMVDTVEDTASAGHWTAAATLMADFDVDNNPLTEAVEDDGVSLSGEITNFMSEGESLSNWKVTLKAIDTNVNSAADTTPAGLVGIQAPTTFAAQTGDTTATPAQVAAVAEWSRGGAAMGTGTWTYTFRGLAGTTATETGNTAQPGAVTGDFNASVGQRAYIVGSFGATMTEE